MFKNTTKVLQESKKGKVNAFLHRPYLTRKNKSQPHVFSQLSTLTFCARVQSVHIRTRLNLIVREVPPLDTSDLSAISGSKFRK